MYIQDVDLVLKEWAFSQRKNLPWEAKLNLTETRIIDWNNYWDGMTYVSFSGGLDSTVMLHFVRKVLRRNVPAIFVNTGLEFPEIRAHVGKFDNVTELRPKKSHREVIKEYGYPLVSKEVAATVRKLRHGNLSDRYRNYLLHGDSRGSMGKLSECWKCLIDAPFDTSDKCCHYMKIEPIHRYQRETGRYPFIGVTQDESYRRQRQYEKTGCNVYDAKDPISKPMGFWTKQDTLRYVVENDLEISSVYGDIVFENGLYRTTGEQRTGCMWCTFGIHLESFPNRYQRLAAKYPKIWEYCIKPYESGGLGFGEVLEFIKVAYEPNLEYIPGSEYKQCRIAM